MSDSEDEGFFGGVVQQPPINTYAPIIAAFDDYYPIILGSRTFSYSTPRHIESYSFLRAEMPIETKKVYQDTIITEKYSGLFVLYVEHFVHIEINESNRQLYELCQDHNFRRAIALLFK